MDQSRVIVLCAALAAAPFANATDRDGDGIDDAEDNCLEVPNAPIAPAADQCDTNNDGLGNHCDADLNNDCIVNSFDLSVMRENFGATGKNDADLNCDGVVNSFDLSRMRQAFGRAPGPSTLWNGCAVSCNDTLLPVPVRWVESPRSGQIVAGSSQVTTTCADGAKMRVQTTGLTPGDTYTMWFGWFEHPENCMFPPPQPDNTLNCGILDLFNEDADANFIYGTGKVATGQNDVFEAMVLTGVDPKGAPYTAGQCVDGACRNEWTGYVADDAHPGVLQNPEGAEFHSVFRNHGPEDAAYMPDQIETHDGGCNQGEPYHPCRTEQLTGAASEIPNECLLEEDPASTACIETLLVSEPGALVVGKGAGAPTLGTDMWMQLTLVAQHIGPGATEAIGLCRLKHYEQGRLRATVTAQIDCVSAPNTVAFTTGIITEVVDNNPDDNVTVDRLLGTPIAVTVSDNNNEADGLLVNVPAWTDVPILGGGPSPPGDGCDSGVNAIVVEPENGNFWVSD